MEVGQQEDTQHSSKGYLQHTHTQVRRNVLDSVAEKCEMIHLCIF